MCMRTVTAVVSWGKGVNVINITDQIITPKHWLRRLVWDHCAGTSKGRVMNEASKPSEPKQYRSHYLGVRVAIRNMFHRSFDNDYQEYYLSNGNVFLFFILFFNCSVHFDCDVTGTRCKYISLWQIHYE